MTTSNTIINDRSKDDKEYHGIIINLSQRDKSIFKTIEIIGKRKLLFGNGICHKK